MSSKTKEKIKKIKDTIAAYNDAFSDRRIEPEEIARIVRTVNSQVKEKK